MAVNIAACVTAFLISFITLPLIIKYFLEKRLVDIPGRRKIHKKITPSMGGISIFVGFLIASFIWLDFAQIQYIRLVLASLFIVFLIGVRDDIVPFRALHKLSGQIISILILLFSPIHINSLYGLFGVNEIPLFVGYALTILTIVIITNSFNLIDGLDGLAGSVGLVALLAFGVWFFLADDLVFSLLCFAMIGGILAFLIFNWEPSEIFMGDTGAMVIGMLLSILVIRFMNNNDALPGGNPIKFTATIASAACFIIVPLSDTLRIIILRISKGQSPFHPDKSHIHHAIMRLGVTHASTSIILASANILFVVGAFILKSYSEKYVLAGVILVAFVSSLVLDRLIIHRVSTKKPLR
jgi:UDP-N-acetylmuramyl pentapeptide phosphotransferase/UDP-N-acetylglucosamine-1-phosphate transferase